MFLHHLNDISYILLHLIRKKLQNNFDVNNYQIHRKFKISCFKALSKPKTRKYTKKERNRARRA